MKKMTFIDFLMEVDVGDLQFAKQAQQKQQQQMDATQGRENFKNSMKALTPGKRNVIIDKDGQKFMVLGGSMDGIKAKQLGGQSTTVFPHNTKYKPLGKSEHGVVMFKEI